MFHVDQSLGSGRTWFWVPWAASRTCLYPWVEEVWETSSSSGSFHLMQFLRACPEKKSITMFYCLQWEFVQRILFHYNWFKAINYSNDKYTSIIPVLETYAEVATNFIIKLSCHINLNQRFQINTELTPLYLSACWIWFLIRMVIWATELNKKHRWITSLSGNIPNGQWRGPFCNSIYKTQPPVIRTSDFKGSNICWMFLHCLRDIIYPFGL